MKLLKAVPEKGKWMLWFTLHDEKLSFKSIDKWLHSIENGESVIDILINMKNKKLCFTEEDFFKINVGSRNSSPWATYDEQLPDIEHVLDSLNEYFKEHNYPFKALHNDRIAYIVQKKPLFCISHNKKITTESDLIEHRDCLSKDNLIHKIKPKEPIKDNIVDDIDAATKERLERKRAEEIKARRDY